MKLDEKRKNNLLQQIALYMEKGMEIGKREFDNNINAEKSQREKLVKHLKKEVVKFFQKVASKPFQKQMCKLALVTCLGAATVTSYGMPVYACETKKDIKPNNKIETKINNDVRQNDLLVILVEFNDTKHLDSDNELSSRIFGDKGDTLNNFYKMSSQGKFMFKPANETAGDKNDGVIRVKVDKNLGDTIEEITSQPKTQKEALKLADKDIDFAKYDVDKNGYITTNELDISFVIANVKTSELETYNFTAFASQFAGEGVTADGVKVGELIPYEIRKGFKDDGSDGGNYTVTLANMTADRKENTNVLAHELAHTFGARDLYNGYGKTSGLGYYSVMSHGTTQAGWSDFDAWTKTKLGFVKPIEIDTKDMKAPAVQSVHSISSTRGKANIIKINTSDPKQYFLVENRVENGLDKSIEYGTSKGSKGGILIYHINENNHSNFTQEGSKDYLVDVEEADNLKLGYSRLDTNKLVDKNWDMASNAFYTADEGGVAVFGPEGVINSSLANGTKTGIQIEILSPAGNDMNIRISVTK